MTATTALDPAKLEQFVFRAVEEVGATLNAALVVMGDKLGLYRAMAGAGPLSPAELADRSGVAERYAREWLNNQAAGGYVEYDPESGRYTLPAEQTVALTDADSPAYLPGIFQIALGAVSDSPRITEAARSGGGVGWHDHNGDVHDGCERFFRTMYNGHLIGEWLPALDGVVAKLQAGATVADIGCGHGASTVIMAQAFPKSTFLGYDFHDKSIAKARERAAEAGVGDRVKFTKSTAREFPGGDLDLVCFFDCLHDMGDPVGAARHVREALNPGGTVLVVEPAAADRPEDNHHPLGRLMYAASTMFCTPASLHDDGGLGLGNQVGVARLTELLTQAGYSSVRLAASTPLNLVLEARV